MAAAVATAPPTADEASPSSIDDLRGALLWARFCGRSLRVGHKSSLIGRGAAGRVCCGERTHFLSLAGDALVNTACSAAHDWRLCQAEEVIPA